MLFNFSSLLKTVRAVFREVGNGVYIIHEVAYEGLQLVDGMLEEISTKRDILTCPGYYLDDHFGPLVDVRRESMEDDQYRFAILIRMLAIRTAGATNQLLKITRYILGPDPTITFEPFYPKAWVIKVIGADPKVFLLVAPLLVGLATAGENGIILQVDTITWAPISTYGPVVEGGWFSSVYGPVDGTAGMAHAVQI